MNEWSGWWISGCLLSGNGLRNENYYSVATRLPFPEHLEIFHELLLIGIRNMMKVRYSLILECTSTKYLRAS